jgi:glycosyltransferase involved in cell wall biosynthesis
VRLRVALDATPLLGHATGVGVFCQGALGALATRPSLSVSAYAVSWRRRHGIDAFLPSGVAARHRPMPARPLHALWARVDMPALEWFVGPTDVVHGTNFVVPPTGRAGAVVSVHDLTPVHHPELCNRATLAFPALIRRALNRGAWVHADSAFVAGEVVEAFRAPPDRVRVVHPGVPSLPAPSGEETAAVLSRVLPPGATRYCLAVGTAEPRKDLPGLVRAFTDATAGRDDVALVLAGPPGWGEDALTEAMAGSPAQRRIVRTGWVPQDALGALVAGADLLAYPSLYEGFGFPPLQAMQAGVPVVATGAGSLREVLGDAALMVEPGNHDALVHALQSGLGDESERQRLRAAGTDRVALFSWERCGEGLEALYRDVAGSAGG